MQLRSGLLPPECHRRGLEAGRPSGKIPGIFLLVFATKNPRRRFAGPLMLRLVRAQPGQRDIHEMIVVDCKPPAKASSLILAKRGNSTTKCPISGSSFF